MKTPREILLARHRAAGPKLDAIRRAVVNDLNNKDVKAQSRAGQFGALCLRCLGTPWRELVLPNRRVWTGLAAVWGVILIINVSQRDRVSSVTGKPVSSAPVIMSWQVQQRWMNELLTDRSMPSEADRPRNVVPRPHTENCGITTV
jgi:hypothetical protein